MRLRRFGPLTVLPFLLACGSWASGGGSSEQRVPVQVDNDLTTRSDVTVRMHSSTGASRVLGGAPPGGERLFEYRDQVLSGFYRLSARTSDGRTIESRTFTLFPGAGVVWRLQRNDLQVVNAEVMEEQTEPYGGVGRLR